MILFSRLDDRGLLLRNLLNVLLSSVCGILRSGSSSTAVGTGSWTPTSTMLSSLKFIFFLLATGYCCCNRSFPLPQCGSCYFEQRAPETSATAVTQQCRGTSELQGRRHRRGWSPAPSSYCNVEKCRSDHS